MNKIIVLIMMCIFVSACGVTPPRDYILQSKEIEKLKNDMKTTDINFGIFISLNSKIIGKKHMEIERFDNKKSHCKY